MVKLRSEILPEKPGRSPANRSLERGIEVLRAFRPGSELLGNSDLVERTGLSKATVCRLAQTLAGVGMLELDAERRAYRLGPAVLSLAHSMRTGSRVLNAAAPLMRTLAETKRINVGLAAPDRDEMVYLESIRYSRRIVHRHVVSGQRVPMELTSLGRAYLAVAPALQRKALMAGFKKRRQEQWVTVQSAIQRAREEVNTRGFCSASWQPEVVALATPMVWRGSVYVLNCSLSTLDPIQKVEVDLGDYLLQLREDVLRRLADSADAFD